MSTSGNGPVYAPVRKRSRSSLTRNSRVNSSGYTMITPEPEPIYNQPKNAVIYTKQFDLTSIDDMLDKIRTVKNVIVGIFIVTEKDKVLDNLDLVYDAFNAGTFKTIILLITGSTYRNYNNIELTKLKNGLIKESAYYTAKRERTTMKDILGKAKNNNAGPVYIPLTQQTRNISLYRSLSSVRSNSGTRKRSRNSAPPPVKGFPPPR